MKIRKYLTVALTGLLLGCIQSYSPVALQVNDQRQYQEDILFCQTVSARYSPLFDGNSVVLGFLTGGANNVSEAPLNPLIPVIGAAGGAVSSGAQGLDIFSQTKINVFKNCLHDKTMQDKSALVANPN